MRCDHPELMIVEDSMINCGDHPCMIKTKDSWRDVVIDWGAYKERITSRLVMLKTKTFLGDASNERI